MKKSNIFKSLGTLVLLLSIAVIQINSQSNTKNYLANSYGEFKNINISDEGKPLSAKQALIYRSGSNQIAGNVLCQEYSKTFHCQISALFDIETNSNLEVWIKTQSNDDLAFLGTMNQDQEGLYLLESIIDNQYLGNEILITSGKIKFAYSNLNSN